MARLDGSDPRKPHVQAMARLQRVTRRQDPGTAPGYRTLNAIGVGQQRRGLLYHRRFSSTAPDVTREPAETQQALASLGAALAPLDAESPSVLDAGVDDSAVVSAIWR